MPLPECDNLHIWGTFGEVNWISSECSKGSQGIGEGFPSASANMQSTKHLASKELSPGSI